MTEKKFQKIVGITPHYVEKEFLSHYYLYSNYSYAVLNLNALPFVLSVTKKIDAVRRYMELVDGVIISGGGPGIRRKKYIDGLEPSNPKRYNFEKQIILHCYRNKIPLLGICRGHQMIAEVLGGAIDNSFSHGEFHKQKRKPSFPHHDIKLDLSSKFYEIMGRERLRVNSLHSQVVQHVPPGFKVSSRSVDGVIESMELIDEQNWIMSFQFHPEKMQKRSPILQKIFKTFIQQL